ncbi:hypothetical protein [Actinosynnema mirum]|uniref:Uncharacterized protein n=1 Tax=Actinosynnema mirum (strain ATCC 29888 / DSM 43827 / JCM 3225 / NBRC 14064 / NCIMB 13271 / NRRL B-12336 / IMRU 3971 / 101) TaxID=446462 RepID=C6WKG2_ACTMD|nr:hypothetical protein [Actinosynnema mirum]ACU40213.1 hypothetical protein Amir_6412 [Actinosynnema mirum DSM 43827]
MTRFEVSARRVADRAAGVLRAVLPWLYWPALVVVAAGLGVVARLGASEVDRGLPVGVVVIAVLGVCAPLALHFVVRTTGLALRDGQHHLLRACLWLPLPMVLLLAFGVGAVLTGWGLPPGPLLLVGVALLLVSAAGYPVVLDRADRAHRAARRAPRPEVDDLIAAHRLLKVRVVIATAVPLCVSPSAFLLVCGLAVLVRKPVTAALAGAASLGWAHVAQTGGLPHEVPWAHATAVWLIGLTAAALWLSAAAHPAWQADGWDLAGRPPIHPAPPPPPWLGWRPPER